MARFTEKCILLMILTCLVVRLSAVESSSNKLDTSALDYIWNANLLENQSKSEMKTISSILNRISPEDEQLEKKLAGPGKESLRPKPETTRREEPADAPSNGTTRLEDFSAKNRALQEHPELSLLYDEKEEGVNRRSYFPEGIKTMEDLPRPIHLKKSEVASLLAENLDLDSDSCIGSDLSLGDDFISSIVSISNKTEKIPALELFRGFVSDVDSICRISTKWFESYPKFVKVLRRTDHKISGKLGATKVGRSPGNGQQVRLSRRFTNEWISFLGQLKTIVIDSKSYRWRRRELRNYKEINHKDLEQYRRNVYNELQLFNHLLLGILSKLSFYIQYVVYFPSTGRLFGREERRDYLSQFKESYYKRLSDEDSLLKLSRMDIYVNKIPRNALEEVRTSVSSCSGVVKLLHKYGVRSDSTPRAVISLYLQYKRVTRILLNIYNSETDSRIKKPGDEDYESYRSSKDSSPTKSKDNIFDQTLVPNKIGFRPFQTRGEGSLSEERRAERRLGSTDANDRIELDFNYVSKDSALKLQNGIERNLFHLIKQDLSDNQLNKEAILGVIADKRPSGTPGLVIFTQKSDMQTAQHECGAKIMQNGKVEISFRRNFLSSFGGKIASWFRSNYLKHFQESHNGDTIPLLFKLVIACPYVISRNCMQSQCGGIHDVYMLVYLVGKLKEYDDKWKIVTEFNAITRDTGLQWKIASILVPDIRSQAERMCPVQTGSLKSQALKESKHVVFKSPFEFSSFSQLFKHENANIKRSIVRNCLNYIEEETTIEFSTGHGKENAKATCRNSHLYVN